MFATHLELSWPGEMLGKADQALSALSEPRLTLPRPVTLNTGHGQHNKDFEVAATCIFVPEVHSNLSFQAAWAGLILVFLMLCCCCLPWLAGT